MSLNSRLHREPSADPGRLGKKMWGLSHSPSPETSGRISPEALVLARLGQCHQWGLGTDYPILTAVLHAIWINDTRYPHLPSKEKQIKKVTKDSWLLLQPQTKLFPCPLSNNYLSLVTNDDDHLSVCLLSLYVFEEISNWVLEVNVNDKRLLISVSNYFLLYRNTTVFCELTLFLEIFKNSLIVSQVFL